MDMSAAMIHEPEFNHIAPGKKQDVRRKKSIETELPGR
jgi:hypothetical protein